ncbi:cell division protein ZipA C-terminal FtsZ-binding domain-containing protein [Oxalobacter paraformigenes]|uniref:Cell division protein ZipA n=1 Tax=Oxalobacter paraformigenes TaxID=556268 RepID=C3X180_9BURK|nr:cell division protein ZipA C-terminal FtsZ-binding domain-containing protein [Oxalobacter paraformigenes]EEO26966.1 hypothetical protein OFAG_00119 [Oxalobacter paraformigenes]
MTDLQISLIGIGIAIVIGVIAYNKWQEYRARKHVERAFSDPVDDVLMKTDQADGKPERREPVLGNASVSEEPPGFAGSEPRLVLTDNDGNETADDVIPIKVPDVPVDELIELTIPFNPEESFRAEKILPHLQSLRYTGNKPVRFLGWQEGDEGEKNWQTIVPGNSYRQIEACIQIANRNGALNEIEFSELLLRLRQIADAIGAEPDVPEMAEVMEKARRLYQFVSDHDAKLGISICSNGAPWQKVTLNTALEKQGFESRPDGQFVMRDKENGGVLFTLSTNELPASETATRLTLLMDVPCVAPEKEGFSQMIQCGKALCIRLDGALVDDGNQLLTDRFLEEIAGQVNDFYREMQEYSIPAGSARALRLFN